MICIAKTNNNRNVDHSQWMRTCIFVIPLFTYCIYKVFLNFNEKGEMMYSHS